MSNDSITLPPRGQTFRQWLAERLGNAARSLAPPEENASTIQSLKRGAAVEVEVRLLDAMAEQERWDFTVRMLQARLERLTGAGEAARYVHIVGDQP